MAVEGGKAAPAQKVMVIEDATRESAVALQYTLSHAILDNDALILLRVENDHFLEKHVFFRRPLPTTQNVASMPENVAASGGYVGDGVDMYFLEAMKQACEKVQPKIQVRREVVGTDGKDKARVILSQCSEHRIDLLIIRRHRSLSSAILGKQKGNGSFIGTDTVEYLIENSNCTCVAVQKKGQNAGYLLNTKTHRDFRLLA